MDSIYEAVQITHSYETQTATREFEAVARAIIAMLEASSIEHGYLYIYTCLPIQRAIYFNIPSDSSGFTRLLPLQTLPPLVGFLS